MARRRPARRPARRGMRRPDRSVARHQQPLEPLNRPFDRRGAGRFDRPSPRNLSGPRNVGGCPEPRPWATYGRASARLGRWYYRYRWELAPVTWAAVTAVVGVVAAELLATSTILLVAGAVWAGTAIAVRRWKNARYRTHAHAAALATGGWATAASVWGPNNQWVAGALVAATAAVGIPWWLNHAVRDHVVQLRERERWSDIAGQIQLAGSKMLRRKKLTDTTTGREIGWEALIELPPGQTANALAAQKARIESLLGLRIGSVQVDKVLKHARRATMTVVRDDVFTATGEIPHPALAEAWEAGSRSIVDPVPVGVCEDGTTATIQLVDPNSGANRGLTMGAAGGGKSNWINVKLAAAAASSDCVIWYGEVAKRAAKARPWLACLDMPPADTPAKVLAMLKAGEAIIAERGLFAGETYNDDAIPPGSGTPTVLIMLDEFASMVADPTHGEAILASATNVARTGRSLLVSIDIHSQHGSAGAFGYGQAAQLIAQLNIRACFRLAKNEHARFVFPSHYSQIDASALPHDGSFYLSTRGDALPTLHRAYALYKPEDVRKVADRLSTGTRPRLDERSATAAANVLGPLYTNTANAASGDLEEPPAQVRTPPRTLAPAPVPMSADEEERVRVDIETVRERISQAADAAFRRADATRAATGGTGYLTGNTTTLPTARQAVDDDLAKNDEPGDAHDDLARRILDVLDKAAGIPVSAGSIQANFGVDVSRATIVRRLNTLQEAGLVRMVGAGRGAGWTSTRHLE
ncbi:helix-turn-helix domain-containing protein [Actinopolymorpha sp. B11F2]|uniref:helix-turn-helix domain-containing protein n=1 Tax=Actinopolymorpha sp. B11F2 TaxID=3160862 RepID=UPI0032E3895D